MDVGAVHLGHRWSCAGGRAMANSSLKHVLQMQAFYHIARAGNGARAARGAWAGRGGVSGAGEIRAVDPGIWGRASGFAGGRRVRRSTAVGPAGGRAGRAVRVRRAVRVPRRSGRARSTFHGQSGRPASHFGDVVGQRPPLFKRVR